MVSTRQVRRCDAWIVASFLGLAGASGCQGDVVHSDGDDETGSTGGADPGEDPGDDPDDSSGGTDADPPPDDTGDPPSPEDAIPPPGGLRRLLSYQYLASIEYLLGPEAAEAAWAPLDPGLDRYDAMGALSSSPSTYDVETYEGSAQAVARAALDHPQRLAERVPCVVEGPETDVCYEALARDLGRVAWRRPLTDAQVDRLVDVARLAREWGGSHYTGLEYLLTSMLQSPYFLYVVELGEPGETYRELTGMELATRMSLLLLGRIPSAEVLDRAEAGELDTDQGVRDLAWEMLDDPLARQTVGRMFGELLLVRDLPSKGKHPYLFPLFSDALAASMLEETLRLVDDVVFEQQTSVLRLFDSDYTFIDSELTALYGYGPVAPGDWVRVELPEGRRGVLSLSGWLTMTSHNTVNSPTRRGLYVVEQLLCGEVPLPPPEVNPQPVEPVPGQTLRESLSQHVEDEACAGCHSVIDPIGFGFEHFDAIGAWRELDNGQPIDASGDAPALGQFDGADELADRLVASPALSRCLVDQTYAITLGVQPTEAMAPALDAVDLAYAGADHDLELLLVELTASPVFRLVDEPK